MRRTLGIAVIILGIIAGVVFFSAGSKISETGKQMNKLQSQGGTSLAEAYYQDVGDVAGGFGIFAYGVGTAIIALSLGIGGKMIADDKTPDVVEVQETLIEVIDDGHETNNI